MSIEGSAVGGFYEIRLFHAEEVIFYVNVGLKPHAQVREEMARLMEEVAPAFIGETVS